MSFAPFDRTVIWLTRRQLFAKQRLIVAIGLALIPAMIAAIDRFNTADPNYASDFLSTVFRDIVIGVLLPITALVFGTSAFGGEVDDGTLIYLMVKPLPRWRIAFSKYVVAVISTLLVVVPSMFLAWWIAPAQNPLRLPLSYTVGAVVGAMLYCAIFLSLGIASRRALPLGLLYVIAFENVLTRNILGAKSLSVREFALSATKQVIGAASDFVGYNVSMATVWTMGSIFLVVALGISIVRLRKYEVAERL
ncbi:MAG TPA: ABC transporter permease [Gemmatimonadaceae bacterium]